MEEKEREGEKDVILSTIYILKILWDTMLSIIDRDGVVFHTHIRMTKN